MSLLEFIYGDKNSPIPNAVNKFNQVNKSNQVNERVGLPLRQHEDIIESLYAMDKANGLGQVTPPRQDALLEFLYGDPHNSTILNAYRKFNQVAEQVTLPVRQGVVDTMAQFDRATGSPVAERPPYRPLTDGPDALLANGARFIAGGAADIATGFAGDIAAAANVVQDFMGDEDFPWWYWPPAIGAVGAPFSPILARKLRDAARPTAAHRKRSGRRHAPEPNAAIELSPQQQYTLGPVPVDAYGNVTADYLGNPLPPRTLESYALGAMENPGVHKTPEVWGTSNIHAPQHTNARYPTPDALADGMNLPDHVPRWDMPPAQMPYGGNLSATNGMFLKGARDLDAVTPKTARRVDAIWLNPDKGGWKDPNAIGTATHEVGHWQSNAYNQSIQVGSLDPLLNMKKADLTEADKLVIKEFERAYEYGASRNPMYNNYRETIADRVDYTPKGNTPMGRLMNMGSRPSASRVYKTSEDAEEMWVEARRLYQENPDWFRAVYPNAAKMLSTVVNGQARLHKTVLNGIGVGGAGMLGMQQLRPEDVQTETFER